ncbi:HCLS1-associated protein X-1 isoform X2 [Eleutherodactylus coqui]|uniref:HCLS1-associated protein X-1 isoform X2 n=1 Tax=Eleutherodactylus coqui TaxID=57060 RepID=UPI003462E7C0
MSMFELFRRFFHPPGSRDPFFSGMTEDDDDDEEGDDDSFFHNQSGFGPEPPSWRPRPPFHDPFGFEDVFRDFNELFADFGSVIRDVPRLPGVEPPARSPGGSRTGSLRDFMLKYPDSHLPRESVERSAGPELPRWLPRQDDDGVAVPPGGGREDKILDSEVSSRGLDSVLRPADPAPPSAYFRSVSVSRVARPDGTVEERRTVKDSEGNVTTTVTVTSGDQSGGAPTNEDSAPLRFPPDLSDSRTILSRLLQRWFSER